MACSLNEDLLHIQTWADNSNVMYGAAKCLTAERCRNQPPLTFMNTVLSEVEEVELLGISIWKELFWTHSVDKKAKDTGKWLGLLKRVSPYLNPNQQAMIYKIMVRSKMEYVLSVWTAVSETSLGSHPEASCQNDSSVRARFL